MQVVINLYHHDFARCSFKIQDRYTLKNTKIGNVSEHLKKKKGCMIFWIRQLSFSLA